MAAKILINQVGQHIIADVKQVTHKDSDQVIAYWVEHPRIINYTRAEDGNLSLSFLDACPASSETAYGISSHHIASILDPKPEVESHWASTVGLAAPEEAPAEVEVVGDEE